MHNRRASEIAAVVAQHDGTHGVAAHAARAGVEPIINIVQHRVLCSRSRSHRAVEALQIPDGIGRNGAGCVTTNGYLARRYFASNRPRRAGS